MSFMGIESEGGFSDSGLVLCELRVVHLFFEAIAMAPSWFLLLIWV